MSNALSDTLNGLSAGWYYIEIADDIGCVTMDSIEIMDPAVLTGNFDTTICAGGSFVYNGTTYNAGNTNGTEIITTSSGCDSTVTVSLTIAPFPSITIDSTVCDMFTFNGSDYFSSTVVSDTMTSAAGCDSIVNYDFTVIQSVTISDSLTGCDSVTHEGTNYYRDTILRDTIAENLGVPCPSLFISEMIEGAGLDKCIEIYNGTGASINLSGYSIQMYFNGSASAGTTVALSGIIADGGTYVLCDDGANAALLALADQTSTNSFFNGDDAIALYNGSNLVDLIGNIGCDPGARWWGVGNGTLNNSIIRLPNYVNGVTADPANAPCDFPSFVATNWMSTESSTAYGSFGSHNAYCNTSAAFTPHCDSIVETVIVVFNSDSTFATATSCNPADTGTSSVTNPNANACDSVHTLTTTLLPLSFDTFNIISCDSILAAGNWYYSTISFEDTIIGGSPNGCNRITTFNLNINSSDSTFSTSSSCNPIDTGMFSVTNLNQANCDSVHTEVITLDPPILATVDTNFCAGGTYNGVVYTSDTSFLDTVAGGSGSIITTTLFTEDFESGSGAWILNNGVGPNQWFVDNFYAGAPCNFLGVPLFTVPDVPNQPAGFANSPQSNYLHISATTNSGGLCDAPWPPTNANYDATSVATNSTQFAQMNASISTLGMSVVSLNFEYLSVGDISSYGYVEYSLNNGTTWNSLPGTYNNTSNWTSASVTDLVFDNQASLLFRFVWTNTTTGSDPPFCVDEIVISARQPGTSGCDSLTTINITILPNSFETENITACDSALVVGNWILASTSFQDTVVGGAANGCDSITTFNVTINNSDSTFATATSCNPIDTGTASVTNLNTNGCDSVYTITTTLLASDSTFATATSCNPIDTGTASVTNLNTNGCDSVHTITTTLLASDSTFATATSCNPIDTGTASVSNSNTNGCDSVHTITTSLLASDSTFATATSCNPIDTGTASVTNSNASGCDSVHTITTTLLASDSTFATATSCNPIDTGTASVTNLNVNGCDSVHTITTTLLASDSTFATATSCNPIDTGTASVTNLNVNGCDSVHTITTTLLASDSTFATATSCNPIDTGTASVTNLNVNGCDSVHTITTTLLASDSTFATATSCNPIDTGTASVTNLNVSGCDSTHTITTTLLASDSTFATATSCNPIDTGTASVTNLNANGCDSVHTITTTLAPFSSATENITACDSVLTNGTWLFTDSTFNDTIVGGAANGCDTITIFNITINNSDSTFATATSCNPLDTGAVSVTNPNVNACDSVHTITTTLLASDSTFATATSCNPIDTGTASVTNLNVSGCDSVHTVTTTLLASDSTFATATSCNPIDTGTASVTNLNTNGCDSVHTITTTLLASDSTFATATSCNPIDTGTASVTNLNANGCDSTHTITTSLAPFSSATESITACDSVLTNGTWLFTDSTFNDTIVGGAANGCDTITIFNITINNSDSTFATATSCNPIDTGTASVTNLNVNGCDSVHTVTTSLLASDSTFATATSCNPIDTGTASVTNLNVNGCDSVHTITTSLAPFSSATESITACDSVLTNGTWLFTDSTFNDTIVGGAANGCDTITIFNITINNSDSTFATATSCNPIDTGVASVTNLNSNGCDSVHTITTTLLASDSTFATATSCNPIDTGTASVTNLNVNGCDSVHTVTTTLAPFSSATENITTCDSAFANGTWLFADSTFNDTIVGGAANGCDTITIFNITINNSDSTFATATSCNPIDTGTASVTNLNTNGCDSVHTVTTSLLASDSTFATATSCNPIDTGTASVTNSNANGCDSVHTITTTLLASDSTFATTTSCNPIDTGTASVTNLNTNGCDSVHTITITLAPFSSATIDMDVCPNDLPYVLNSNILIDGNETQYFDTISNQFGCDSLLTYNVNYFDLLEVDPSYVVVNSGDSLAFSITNNNGDNYFNYTSSNGEYCGDTCENYFLVPTAEVNYYYFTIIDTASGCVYNDTLQIDINLYSELNVPNIFTPNGDGQNDIYYCYGKDISQFELQIFDRWGGRMFISNDLNTGWDGIFNSFAAESGIYIAIIRATGLDGQKYEITQNIKLVR